MSLVPKAMRREVVARAGHRCEYCHLPTEGQAFTFPIDHVLPRSSGGATTLDNLALACFACNAHKWKHHEGRTSASGASVRLFNPRTDVWQDHFRWSADQLGVLEGVTECGSATVARLQMNEAHLVAARRALARCSLFSELAV